MGGSNTSSNTTINNNTNSNLYNETNNITKTRQEWNIKNIDNTTIEGKQIQGRTVDLSNSGNLGLRCIGLKEGDPRCHMALMEMNFVTAGLAKLGGWALDELHQAEHAFATAGYVIYQGVKYTSEQAYAAALWCYHDTQCHDIAVKLGNAAVKELEQKWSDSHPVTMILLI